MTRDEAWENLTGERSEARIDTPESHMDTSPAPTPLVDTDILGMILQEQDEMLPPRSLTAPAVLVATANRPTSTSQRPVVTPSSTDTGQDIPGPSSSTTPTSDFASAMTPDPYLSVDIRVFAKDLCVDLGLIATILRLQFGATYFNHTPPDRCVEPNRELPSENEWRAIPSTHFTSYAEQLWVQVSTARTAAAATPAGKAATLLYDVILYGPRIGQYASRASQYPELDVDSLMICIFEEVLRYMHYCRSLLCMHLAPTPEIISTTAPLGGGEAPRGRFALDQRFLDGEIYHQLRFASSQQYQDHFGTPHTRPWGFPGNCHFLSDTPFVPPPETVPASSLIYGPPLSSPKEEDPVFPPDVSLMVTPGMDVLTEKEALLSEEAKIDEEIRRASRSPPPGDGQSLQVLQNHVMEELRELTRERLPSGFTLGEWKEFRHAHPHLGSVDSAPLTTNQPPGHPQQPVVPFIKEWNCAGYGLTDFRQAQILDGAVEVFVTDGRIGPTNG